MSSYQIKDWEREHPEFKYERIKRRLEEKIREAAELTYPYPYRDHGEVWDPRVREIENKIEEAALTGVERIWLKYYREGSYERLQADEFIHFD